MPKKKIPSYRLHKPSGRAVVTLKGKDFYLGEYNSKASWEEYQRVIGDYIANDCKLPPTRSWNEITVEDAAVKFLEWAEGYYLKNGKPTRTFTNYRESLSHVIRWYGGNPISDFGPLALQFVRDKLLKEGYVINRNIDGKLIECREAYSHAQLLKMDLTPHFLIEDVLVEGQPMIVGAPRKCLKTSILLDMAVSLGSGDKFLGRFEILKPCKVLIMSGESGLATILETVILQMARNWTFSKDWNRKVIKDLISSAYC